MSIASAPYSEARKYVILAIVMAIVTVAAYSALRAVDETKYASPLSYEDVSAGGNVHLRFDLEAEMCTDGMLDYLSIPAPDFYGLTVFVDGVVPFYYPRFLDYCLEKGKVLDVYGAYDPDAKHVVAHKVVYDGGARTIIPDTPLVLFVTLFLGMGCMCSLLFAAIEVAKASSDEGDGDGGEPSSQT